VEPGVRRETEKARGSNSRDGGGNTKRTGLSKPYLINRGARSNVSLCLSRVTKRDVENLGLDKKGKKELRRTKRYRSLKVEDFSDSFS